MKVCKSRIKKYFDRSSDSYEEVAFVQRQSAEFLVSKVTKIQDFAPISILDLGSGTGYVPEILLQYYPSTLYTLNDISLEMLQKSKNKFSKYSNNISFCAGDMEEIDFKDQSLIISNFAFQWVDNLSLVLNKFYQKSDVFAFSCPIFGTFAEWNQIMDTYDIETITKEYYTDEQLLYYCQNICQKSKYHFWIQDYHIKFANILDFMRYLKSLGANINKKNISNSLLKSLITRYNSPLSITYKVFFAILEK